MGEVRLCSRAYEEFQQLMKDMKYELSKIDEEWKEVANMIQPKCGICTEKENCEL